MLLLALSIAALFSPPAAAMAFIITYREYARHALPRRDLLARSLHAAIVTLVFFLALGAALGWFLADV